MSVFSLYYMLCIDTQSWGLADEKVEHIVSHQSNFDYDDYVLYIYITVYISLWAI